MFCYVMLSCGCFVAVLRLSCGCLVLSCGCFVLSCACLVVSCLALPCLVLSCLGMCCFILYFLCCAVGCFVLSCACLVVSCHVLPCLAMSCLVLSGRVLFYLVFFVLCCAVLSCVALCCLVLYFFLLFQLYEHAHITLHMMKWRVDEMDEDDLAMVSHTCRVFLFFCFSVFLVCVHRPLQDKWQDKTTRDCSWTNLFSLSCPVFPTHFT